VREHPEEQLGGRCERWDERCLYREKKSPSAMELRLMAVAILIKTLGLKFVFEEKKILNHLVRDMKKL
jgi:hypothetical protein